MLISKQGSAASQSGADTRKNSAKAPAERAGEPETQRKIVKFSEEKSTALKPALKPVSQSKVASSDGETPRSQRQRQVLSALKKKRAPGKPRPTSQSSNRSKSRDKSSEYETEDSFDGSQFSHRKNMPLSYLSCRTTDQLLSHLIKHHQDYQGFHKSPHLEVQRRIHQIKQKHKHQERSYSNEKQRRAQQAQQRVRDKKKLDRYYEQLEKSGAQYLKPQVQKLAKKSQQEKLKIPDYMTLHHKLHKSHSPTELEKKQLEEQLKSTLQPKKVPRKQIPYAPYNFIGPYNSYKFKPSDGKRPESGSPSKSRSGSPHTRNEPAPYSLSLSIFLRPNDSPPHASY